jgi:single-stranded DNA-binding protein
MGDVNKTTHTGVAITNPSFTYLGNGTPIAIFSLKVKETWSDKSGAKQSRDNLLKFEGLSKNAYWIKENVAPGKRYYIDGYARTDVINGVEEQKFRVLHISEESSDDFTEGKKIGYKDGVAQALAIVKNSASMEAVCGKLELLLTQK